MMPSSQPSDPSNPSSFLLYRFNQESSIPSPEGIHAFDTLYTPPDQFVSLQPYTPYTEQFTTSAADQSAYVPLYTVPQSTYPPNTLGIPPAYFQAPAAPLTPPFFYDPAVWAVPPIPPILAPTVETPAVEEPKKRGGSRKATTSAKSTPKKKAEKKPPKVKTSSVRKPAKKAKPKPKAPAKNPAPLWYTHNLPAVIPILDSATSHTTNIGEQHAAQVSPSANRQMLHALPQYPPMHNSLPPPPAHTLGPLELQPAFRASPAKKSKYEVTTPVRPRSAGTVQKASPLHRHGPQSSPLMDRIAHFSPSYAFENGGFPPMATLRTPPPHTYPAVGTPRQPPPPININTHPRRMTSAQQLSQVFSQNGAISPVEGQVQYWEGSHNQHSQSQHVARRVQSSSVLTVDTSLQDNGFAASQNACPASASTAAFPQTPFSSTFDTASFAPATTTLFGWQASHTPSISDVDITTSSSANPRHGVAHEKIYTAWEALRAEYLWGESITNH